MYRVSIAGTLTAPLTKRWGPRDDTVIVMLRTRRSSPERCTGAAVDHLQAGRTLLVTPYYDNVIVVQ